MSNLLQVPRNLLRVPRNLHKAELVVMMIKTIIVKGFDFFLPEDDIKSALSKYFSSCGEITSVIVPTDDETGAVIGCAYIHLKEGVEKALKLSGSYLGGWNLVVEKVSLAEEVVGLIAIVVTVSAVVPPVEVLVVEEETVVMEADLVLLIQVEDYHA
ncbi:unnamed protein product [Arabis nemorensis]|uniref:RRM domain-containing protein n=1 Tax=Arabis nemorensis TaxID=586526 RepID=A0A565B190_9BRAS|nr:unnamed protein product [Arabis nemorensis]